MLAPKVIEGLIKTFLWERYDDRSEFSDFHREMWGYFCLPDLYVALGAPRGHAKTTAGTVAYEIAALMFRATQYTLMVTKSYKLGCEQLDMIKRSLLQSPGLMQSFGAKPKFDVDREDEVILRFEDGTVSRVLVKGSDQESIRGTLWNNKRPDLILCDDLEDQEQVLNAERRKKYVNWFTKDLLPCGGTKTKVRVVGTILHFDSLLQKLVNSPAWKGRVYRAHKDYDDFSEILWPQRFSEERLRAIRQSNEDLGCGDSYAQEYLNMPMSEKDAYFRSEDIVPMKVEDYEKPKRYYIGVDFAISEKTHADYTVFIVAGRDTQGLLHIVEVRRARIDGKQINEEMFSLRDKYFRSSQVEPVFFVESGQIQKALGPFLFDQMIRRGKYLLMKEFVPTKDKFERATSILGMMRAGGVRFDESMSGFESLKQELLRFGRQRIHDDQVDALSLIGIGLNSMLDWEEGDREEGEDDEDGDIEDESVHIGMGISSVTGY